MRALILKPAPPYLWEGPDYSDPESYMGDNNYPRHAAYIQAFERLTGKRLLDALSLSRTELAALQALASADPQLKETSFWARWLLRKMASGIGKGKAG